MTRAAVLPSVPLWLATMIALATETALMTGLAQLPAPSVVVPPQIPIEINLVAAPALTESAAVEAVSGSSVPPIPEPAPSKPESEPEPPVAPAPAPLPIPIPELTPPRVPVVAVKPKPQPKRKPKPKPPQVAQQSKPAPPIKRPAVAKAIGKSPPAPLFQRGEKERPPFSKGENEKPPFSKGGQGGFKGFNAAAYLNNPAPAYPATARRLRQEGTVQLQVLVSPSGSPSAVSIANSSGVASLDQAALQAVRRWRFKPAQRDGLAVAATVQVPIRFKLN